MTIPDIEIDYQNHPNHSAEKECHGCYPGEGHEAKHAAMNGNGEEGHSFHEHQERYGPFHELHGQFNDGHSRMEHQEMYRNNGGFNEHANVRGNGRAGWGDLHSSILMGGHGGAMGADAHGNGGAGFSATMDEHGFNGFHHGDGSTGSAYGGAGIGAFGAGFGGGGYGGGAGIGAFGGGFNGGNAYGAGWGGYGGDFWNGHAGAGAYNTGWDGAGGRSGLHGGAHVFGHDGASIDNNHAVFGENGLLTPAHGELSIGGAYHTVDDGRGHSNVRFFSGPEHAMFHDMLGHGVPANIVDFYNDTGVVDPATGEFVGGYMHGDSFKGPARRSHKALELARNMATGNGFRRVLIGENAFGRLHGHYGQGGKAFAGAPAHSALVGASEGILTGFNGNVASDMMYLKGIKATAALMQSGAMNKMFFDQFEDWMMKENTGGLNVNTIYDQFSRWEMAHRRSLKQANLNPDVLANEYHDWVLSNRSALVMANGKARVLATQYMDENNANLHFRAAEYDLAQGNVARADMHIKKGKLINAEKSAVAMEKTAMGQLLAAKEALIHGDVIKARALKAGAMCMSKSGASVANGMEAALGVVQTHHENHVFPQGELHAEQARAHALNAETLRVSAEMSKMSGDINLSNKIQADAAQQAAISRAESGFNSKISQSNKKVSTQSMKTLENVEDTSIKAAIAVQDNMNKINTGNKAEFNKSVAMALEDLALKEEAGAHSAANKAIGVLISESSSEKLMDAIAMNDVVNSRLRPPPIKEAFIISNAKEIAGNLIAAEAVNVRKEHLKAEAQQLEMKQEKRKRIETPLEILGEIDHDAKVHIIRDAAIKLPIHGYEQKTARTQIEAKAIKDQFRLRDKLRGKITRRLFDSLLNVIQSGNGFINLPESVSGVFVEKGRIYFTEECKAEKDRLGIDTSTFEHRINTGERRDMAIGRGYFIADLSNLLIDYPTPLNPIPHIIAHRPGFIMDIGCAEGIDIKIGEIRMTPWNIYLKKLRPVVNQFIKVIKQDKKAILALKKKTKIEAKVKKIVNEDKKMLAEIASTKKSIIINPDGQAYIELTPVYGVRERIKVEEAKNLVRSKLLTRGEMQFGQNGISEIKGESTKVCDMKKVLGNATDVARISLINAAHNKNLSFIINSKNAFSGKDNVYKERIKEDGFKGEVVTVVQGVDKGVALKVGEKTAFEKGKIRKEKEEKIKDYLEVQEEQEARGEYAFEEHLKETKMKVGNIYCLPDERLIKVIEDYMNTSLESMHEFDFMFEGYSFFKARDVLLKKVRKLGLSYLEWRNVVKKMMKINIIFLHDMHMSRHVMFNVVTKITDDTLNAIRAYLILPVLAPVKIKLKINDEYEKAISELKALFGDDSEKALKFIRKEILNIEREFSTEGGTFETLDKNILIPVKHETGKFQIKDSHGIIIKEGLTKYPVKVPVRANVERVYKTGSNSIQEGKVLSLALAIDEPETLRKKAGIRTSDAKKAWVIKDANQIAPGVVSIGCIK